MSPQDWRTFSLDRLLARLGRLSHRKWRLLACAAVRRLRRLSSSAEQAVALAERFADGRAAAHELANARYSGRFTPGHPAWAVCWAPDQDGEAMVRRAFAWVTGLSSGSAHFAAERRASEALADLVRDVAAHHFQPVRIDPLWLSLNDRAVLDLAQAIHDEQAFERMPILGDALEEAGCSDEAILTHCRQAGHVRGCWLVDLLMGRE